ncbi:pyoverdine/dityrosine biosynthesis protein [Cordyceps javanica]|uniref:Pyoverdine/dityrosine biosynthesis protein n=1 Tax=Cordyceps javanica TaxID=43265 RepID=A0A545VX66_9HYPO|nr:pyoverdine/dityrosine biosynthesis protein [Cordyceps javanica]TQW06275.1 pyoverdine/dityrosine biosynthesis protein [Cordyceps javanica]
MNNINKSAAKTELTKTTLPSELDPRQQTVDAVTGVLNSYRLAQNGDLNWENTIVRSQLEAFVAKNEQVELVLPAFPFKSPNRRDKVLGFLPDAGEEYALKHLDGLCAAIQQVYVPGAVLTIISDGLVYNDLLGVADEEVWEYGEVLRQIAVDHSLCHLRFQRQHDIFDCDIEKGPICRRQYLKNVPKLRQRLVQDMPSDLEVKRLIATDMDTTLVYRGYLRFLELDLAITGMGKTKTQQKKRIRAVAKQMIGRGHAFRARIAAKYPDCIRLSIHASTDVTKLSISLTGQKCGQLQTPWHSALVRAVNGEVTMCHRAAIDAATHELVVEDGRPAYFRERSTLFDWPELNVEFRYLYPTGIMVSAKDEGRSYSLREVPMQKLRALATRCSPVILRGFGDTTDKKTFIASANDLGTPAPWKFGVVASVRNARGTNTDAANAIVTSNEAMPMHQDGFFFLKPAVTADGTVVMRSAQPRFQYFSAVTEPAAAGTGRTLFASSRLLFQHLGGGGGGETVERLRGLTWDCRHSSDWDEHMRGLRLVVPHPETGEDCLHFMEPWPRSRTRFAYNSVSVENGPQRYLEVVTRALYDYRVTLRFEWCRGDVLLSDNFAMLHTRTAFAHEEERELWRIHVN